MDSIETRVKNAAFRQKELLDVLKETDYIPPALKQQKRYVADLEREIAQMSIRIKTLESNRLKELKDHERYQKSVMKRFAYKITGKGEKFDAKAEKEEKEYFEAIQEEHIAKQIRESTLQSLEAAKVQQAEFEGGAARHARAQQDLDELYDSIFHGPSPGFPEEDEMESRRNEALGAYNDLRNREETEEQVVKILGAAQQKMRNASEQLASARSSSQMDMFSSGVMFDMMERHALGRAVTELSECNILIMQAQRFSPEVSPLPPVQIASGHLMSDVLFDNPFTDMMFHERIKQSQVEQGRAAWALDQQVGMAQARAVALSQRVSRASDALERARLALQKAREEAFVKVTKY